MNSPKKLTYVELVSTLQTINIFRGLTFIEDDFKYIDELMSLLSQQTVNQKNTN